MRLIITADDFGRSAAINAAVIEAHRHGILTSASLMAAGDAFADAVDRARATPTLAVGLHLVIVDGAPMLPADRLAGLVGDDGRFPDAPARLGCRYFFDPSARARIGEEIEAQFARFAGTGMKLAHVDGHQHMHLHPAIIARVIACAKRHGAAAVRVPRDELRFGLRYDRRHALRKIAWTTAFGALGWRARRLVRKSGLFCADRVYGLMQTGAMEEDYLLALLDHMTGETAEIYFHPTTGARLNALGPNPLELQTLLSDRVRKLIAAKNAQLCAYPDCVIKLQ